MPESNGNGKNGAEGREEAERGEEKKEKEKEERARGRREGLRLPPPGERLTLDGDQKRRGGEGFRERRKNP